MKRLQTITSHLFDQHTYSKESLELGNVISQLVLAAKVISREVNRAGLVDILGSTGTVNVQQEEVQKLDEYANTIVIALLKQSPYVKAVGTEELKGLVVFSEPYHTDSQYIVYVDPLDGSSNIDVNVSVGTNFVIFKKKSNKKFSKADYLQPGKQAVCAGYVVYGSSTMLVYTTNKGVHGFTLDPSLGEFILSHEQIQFPQHAEIYSINESYEPLWSPGLKQYIQQVKTSHDLSGKAKTSRYIGSLVADFHRNLLKGGIFLYPADKKNLQGKLRLLYEGIPFALLAAEAGGYASSGHQAVLDIQPTDIHQRIPFFVGTTADVKKVEKLIKNKVQ